MGGHCDVVRFLLGIGVDTSVAESVDKSSCKLGGQIQRRRIGLERLLQSWLKRKTYLLLLEVLWSDLRWQISVPVNNGPDATVPQYVIDLLEDDSQCPLVVAHDVENPWPINNLLSIERPVVVVQSASRSTWNCSGSSENNIGSVKVQPHLKTVKCALFLIICCSINYEDIMDSVLDPDESAVVTQKARDHFVIWIRDSQSVNFMLEHPANKLKYKVAVTNTDVVSVCYFCNNAIETSGSVFKDYGKNLHGTWLMGISLSPVSDTDCAKSVVNAEICFLGEALNFRWKVVQVDFSAILGNMSVAARYYEDFLNGKFGFIPYGPVIDIAFMFFRPVSPHDNLRITFITRQPRRINTPFVFLWPYQLVPWCLMVASLVASSAFLALISRSSLVSNIQCLMRVMIEQYPHVTTQWLSRVFILMWSFLAIIFGTGYRSKLYYFQTFPTLEHVPETILELIHFGYDVYVEAPIYSSLLAIMHDSDDNYFGQYDELVKRMTPVVVPLSDSCGQILQEDVACFEADYWLERITIPHIDMYGSGSILLSSDSLSEVYQSVMVLKAAIYGDNFHYMTSLFHSIGLKVRESQLRKHRYLLDASRARHRDGVSHDEEKCIPFALHSLAGIFLILICGCAAGTFTLLVELTIAQKVHGLLLHRRRRIVNNSVLAAAVPSPQKV